MFITQNSNFLVMIIDIQAYFQKNFQKAKFKEQNKLMITKEAIHDT